MNGNNLKDRMETSLLKELQRHKLYFAGKNDSIR